MRLRKLAENIEMQATTLASEIRNMLDFGDSDIRKEFYDPSKLSYGYQVAEAMVRLSNAVELFDKELNVENKGNN
jgi:hypothetical protein